MKNGALDLLLVHSLVVAIAAEGLVDILLAEDHEFLAVGKTVRVVRKGAAADADGMDLLDILGNGEKSRNRAERLPEVVGIETGDYDPDPAVGEFLADFDEGFIEELGLVNAYDFHVGSNLEHTGRCFYRSARDAVGIVRDYV